MRTHLTINFRLSVYTRNMCPLNIFCIVYSFDYAFEFRAKATSYIQETIVLLYQITASLAKPIIFRKAYYFGSSISVLKTKNFKIDLL